MRSIFYYSIFIIAASGLISLLGVNRTSFAENGPTSKTATEAANDVESNLVKNEANSEQVTADEFPAGQAPRFMLLDSAEGSEHLSEQPSARAPSERDFDWERLTAGSPASGADPIIGDSRVASFYDYMDGHPLPYFIAKKK